MAHLPLDLFHTLGKEERIEAELVWGRRWTLPGSVYSGGSNGKSQTERKAWTGTATDCAQRPAPA